MAAPTRADGRAVAATRLLSFVRNCSRSIREEPFPAAMDPRLASLRALAFDFDGTLYDFRAMMRRCLEAALDEIRRRCPDTSAALTVDLLIELRDAAERDLAESGATLTQVRLEGFRRALRSLGQENEPFAQELNRLYLERRFAWTEPYPDVVPTLDALKPHYTLGILSNGNSRPDQIGVTDYFGFVVLSEEAGVRKPDPQIIDIVLERAGCTRHELALIGDSLETDIGAANAAGVVGVWVNRDRAPRGETDPVPDYEVQSLGELLGLLSAAAP